MFTIGVKEALVHGNTEQANRLINQMFCMVGKDFRVKERRVENKNKYWFDENCKLLKRNTSLATFGEITADSLPFAQLLTRSNKLIEI
ncbi:MAG: hypothetical protein Q8893_02605 [Candidatus Phytoplasma australasiaticum]|nr:hypothetical protein [Candidatus Phytoplasma australasiaticum]